MGLSTKKEEQLRKMPLVEFHAAKSKDGKYIIHRTTITDIKPVAYYHKVLSESGAAGANEISDDIDNALSAMD